jgi:hypothetical protein
MIFVYFILLYHVIKHNTIQQPNIRLVGIGEHAYRNTTVAVILPFKLS